MHCSLFGISKQCSLKCTFLRINKPEINTENKTKEGNLSLQNNWFEDYVEDAKQNYNIAKILRILIYKFLLKIQHAFFSVTTENPTPNLLL